MNKKELKQGAKWSMTGLGGRMVLSFISAPILISKIGLEGYGIILLLSLYSYNGIIQFFDFGLPLVLQKKFAVHRHETEEQLLTLTGFLLMLIFGIFSCTIIITSVFLFPSVFKLGIFLSQYQKYVYILGLLIIVQFLASFYSSYLLSKKQIVIVKKWEAILNIFWSGWAIISVFIFSTNFIKPFLIGNLILNLIGLLSLSKTSKIILRKDLLNYKKISFSQNFISLWKSSFLLKLNGLTFKQSDALIVSLILSPGGLSLLDISTKFMSLGKTVMGKLNELSFVHFNTQSNEKNEGKTTKLETDFFKMLNVQIIIISIMSYFLIFFPEELLKLWLGNNYISEAILYVRISGLILLFVPYAHLLTNYLIATNDEFKRIISTIAKVSIFNIICSFLLAKFYGVLGVLIATLIQHLILQILLLKHAKLGAKSLKYHFNLFIKLLISLALIGFVVTIIGNSIQGLAGSYIKLITSLVLFIIIFFILFKNDDYIKSLIKSFKKL